MVLTFINTDDRGRAQSILQNQVGADFALRPFADTEGAALELTYTDAKIQEINEYAVGQNLTTLRNRINELGVAEALVQSQGTNRIVVELPGVQDTAEAKRVLGRTANLEFRMVSEHDMNYAGGIPPAGTEALHLVLWTVSPCCLNAKPSSQASVFKGHSRVWMRMDAHR